MDDFPRRKALTRGFRLGAPRTVTISPDGGTLIYLRSQGPTDPVNHLWTATWAASGWSESLAVDVTTLGIGAELPAQEQARRERMREVSGGITGYTVARDWSAVAFTLSGTLWLHNLSTGTTTALPGADFVTAALDADASHLAATRGGALVVLDTSTGSEVLAIEPESDTVSWGSAEFIAAEEMGRFVGSWWSPDGTRLLATRVDETAVDRWWIGDPAQPSRPATPVRYPAAGTANATVQLFVLGLDGGRTEIRWDRSRYEYLTSVRWDDTGIVLAVQDRSQRSVLTLTADPGTGETTQLAQDHDGRWVELTPGAPRLTARGLVTVRVDHSTDARRLMLTDSSGVERTVTPPGLQVRSVVAEDDDGLTVTGSDIDPSECDLWNVAWDGSLTRLSQPGGWSGGTARAATTVVARAGLESSRSSLSVTRFETNWEIPSLAEAPNLRIAPEFLTDDRGWGRIAVLWPTEPVAGRLPVVMSPYGGPHSQRAIRAAGAFGTEQWLADQGFCVVVADGPGSPSRPSNEYSIHGDLATGPLNGQISALEQVAERFGDLVDVDRVGIRGWSFGGYLAALAVLERPDVFHAAVAGAPVTAWELYDTHYTERYLGTPDTDPEAYERSSLLPRAAASTTRPLLLIHGLADDNVVAAHTLRLSSALLAAGSAHTVLPLSGVTHMTPQEVVTENLLRLELEFLTTHLR